MKKMNTTKTLEQRIMIFWKLNQKYRMHAITVEVKPGPSIGAMMTSLNNLRDSSEDSQVLRRLCDLFLEELIKHGGKRRSSKGKGKAKNKNCK